MKKTIKVPGPEHPITISPTGMRVIARVGERVIADPTSALTMREANDPSMQHIPLDDVDGSVLRRSETTTSCPFKGNASYDSITTSGVELADATWTDETPYPPVADIAGYVAFYTDRVQVSVVSA